MLLSYLPCNKQGHLHKQLGSPPCCLPRAARPYHLQAGSDFPAHLLHHMWVLPPHCLLYSELTIRSKGLTLSGSNVFSCLSSSVMPGASFPGGSVVKKRKEKLPASAEDSGLIPGLGRFPGERNGNPLQYSCLGNPMDRGAWWALKSQT